MDRYAAHRRVLRWFGNPKIYLVEPGAFKYVAGGFDIKGSAGGAATLRGKVVSPITTVAEWLDGWPLVATLVHEINHIIWPGRPEWYIYGASYKMCGRRGGFDPACLRKHTLDEIPPSSRLWKLARRAAGRLSG